MENADISSFFKDYRIAVTGAAGTVGQKLAQKLLSYPVKEVRLLDNNESALFLLGESYINEPRAQIFFADIRDKDKMAYVFKGINFVFHAAALKHVSICERSPFSTVNTNIYGVQNIIQASLANNVQKVLFTSSDKAVNSTNVMGTSKLMGERLMTAANILQSNEKATVFASTRFGNVAGSSGSVIPLFCQQILHKGVVSLTHSDMTRFVMTVDEAVRLLIETMVLANGGEVFITKMEALKIKDMAEVMIDLLAPLSDFNSDQIKIVEIGIRTGEKLYEELMNEEEIQRSLELEDFFIILPAFRNSYKNIDYVYGKPPVKPVEKSYNSRNSTTMSKDAIKSFLMRPNILPVEIYAKITGEKGSQ